jgi:amino acid transporter
MKFHRSIGSVALLFTALGSIVGSGWLFGPLFAAQVAGPAAILSWVIGGILMIIIALTFAELSTTFPEAGGMIKFAEYSHGPLMSFTVGWMVWLSSVVVAPVETLAILQYMATYVPGLIKPDTIVLTGMGIVAAAILMLIMCLLNFYGAKFFSRVSTVMVVFKLIVPILTIIVLLSLDFHTDNLSVTAGFMPTGWHGVFAALPLGGVIFSFIGYSTAIQLAGEARNPQRSIPIAIIGSLLFCVCLYGLLQLAFIVALDPKDLANGWTHLSFQGESGPFASILLSAGFIWVAMLIYTDAVISPLGTGFIYTQ